MINRLVTLVAVALLATGLTACGDGPTGPTTLSPTPLPTPNPDRARILSMTLADGHGQALTGNGGSASTPWILAVSETYSLALVVHNPQAAGRVIAVGIEPALVTEGVIEQKDERAIEGEYTLRVRVGSATTTLTAITAVVSEYGGDLPGPTALIKQTQYVNFQ
jgi:hypothetical protein